MATLCTVCLKINTVHVYIVHSSDYLHLTSDPTDR